MARRGTAFRCRRPSLRWATICARQVASRRWPARRTCCRITKRSIEWIRAQHDNPWVLHLSYVKPHWPYVAPAPWHAVYRGGDVGPIQHGAEDGTADEHPVVRAYREHDECKSFAREDVARHVRP